MRTSSRLLLTMLIFITSSKALVAQTIKPSFSVRYFHHFANANESIQNIKRKVKNFSAPSRELTVTDKSAFINHYNTERERKINPIGSKFRSHNGYYDAQTGIQYFQSEPWGMKKYLVVDSFPQIQFDLLKDSISIMGYTCYKAVQISEVQNRKATYWYATTLPYPYGPDGYTGLPGLTLAVDYNSRFGQRFFLIASLIEPEQRTVTNQPGGTLIQKAAFYELLKKLQPVQ